MAKTLTLFTRLRLRMVGMDVDLVEAHSPDRDITNGLALWWILMAVFLWQGLTFTGAAHISLARPGDVVFGLALIGFGLSSIILLLDSYLLMRGAWYLHGLKELERGGLRVPGRRWASFKQTLFAIFRVGISAITASLMAIYCGMFILAHDINGVLRAEYLAENGALIEKVTAQVDGSIATLVNDQKTVAALVTTAVSEEEALRRTSLDPVSAVPEVREAVASVETISRKKDEAESALASAQQFASDELAGIKGSQGNSGKKGSGPVRKAAQERVANAQARLAAVTREWDAAKLRLEQSRQGAQPGAESRQLAANGQISQSSASRVKLEGRLQEIETALADRQGNRERIIRDAVEADPSFSGKGTGFLARFQALRKIVENDDYNFKLLLLIDAFLFCIDMAAVLVKTAAYIPSTYAIMLAVTEFGMAATKASELAEMIEKLRDRKKPEDEEPSPPEPKDDATGDRPASEEPPRRRRGRPPRSSHRPDLSPPANDGFDDPNPFPA